jgi:2,4-diketo-3-deoxy-L-fuconate hydrolase
MKLIRIGEVGREKPGVLLEDGGRLDVSGFGSDYDEAFFANDGLLTLGNWLTAHGGSAPHVSLAVRLGAPICRPSKIVRIGLNFRGHAEESGVEIPKEPVIFFKAISSLVGPNDFLVIPKNATKVD